MLLVDGEEVVPIATADMLDEFGFLVTETTSGAEAPDILNAKARIDFLVTDQRMPVMTGMELITAARAQLL